MARKKKFSIVYMIAKTSRSLPILDIYVLTLLMSRVRDYAMYILKKQKKKIKVLVLVETILI